MKHLRALLALSKTAGREKVCQIGKNRAGEDRRKSTRRERRKL